MINSLFACTESYLWLVPLYQIVQRYDVFVVRREGSDRLALAVRVRGLHADLRLEALTAHLISDSLHYVITEPPDEDTAAERGCYIPVEAYHLPWSR